MAMKEAATRLLRAFNLPVELYSTAGKASFKMSGFSYDDFDRGGYVNIQRINRILESGRPMNMKYFYKNNYMEGGQIMVMFAQHFAVSDAFYKRASFDFPMEFTSQVISKSRTSIIRQSSLVEQASGQTMASVRQRVVNMDMRTRRSCDLDPDLVEKYSGEVFPPPEEVFPSIRPEPLPKNHFSTQVEVQHSDMDIYFHTNQASYMEYSLNCAAKASKADFFSEIKGDLCFHLGKKATTFHLWESFAGDILDVHAWEDPSNSLLLHFIISKGKQDIYYSTVEFYEKAP